MDKYIATFFSHFDALTFAGALKGKDIAAKLMPVPRKVSSSCGTCVSFSMEEPGQGLDFGFADCEIEAVYLKTPGGYQKC